MIRERNIESDQRRVNPKLVYDFEVRIWRQRIRWYAQITFRKVDDVDLFLCPWLDYNLSGFGGDMGYSASAFTRAALDRKVAKVKAKIMEPAWEATAGDG